METARPDTQRHGQTGPAGGPHAVRLPDGDGDINGDGDEEETRGGGSYTPCCAGSYLPRRMFLGGWQGGEERRDSATPVSLPSSPVSPACSVPGPTGSRRVPVPGSSTHTGATDTAPTPVPHAQGRTRPGLSEGPG